jgi:hypothetical protein
MVKSNQLRNMKKKGQVQYFLESAFRIGFLMIALLAFFLLINFYVHNRMDTNRLQSEVIANRILYSDAIMWQEKDNPRVYTGIIDVGLFSSTTLDARIDYATKRHATAKLTIIDNIDGPTNYVAYLNKLQYDNLDIIVGKEGKGAATRYTKNYPITYTDGKEYKYGTLMMDIIIPNS